MLATGDSPDAEAGFRRSRSAAFWVTLAVLLLAAVGLLGLALWGHPMAALAGLVCVLAIGLAALMVRQSEDPDGTPLDPQRLGKAPYTKTDCTPNALFNVHLSQLLQELHTTADDRNWVVDWDHVQGFLDRASAAAEDEDHPVERVQEGRAGKDEDEAHHQGADDPPAQDLGLKEGGHGEVLEDHQEDEENEKKSFFHQ